MAKYNINLGFEIDTNKLDKAIRDITARMNELQKKGTLNGLAISEADKTRYIAEMTRLRDAVQRIFTERRFGVDPTIRMGTASPEIEAAARSMNVLNDSLGNNSTMAQRAISQQTKLAAEMKKTREEVDPLQKAMNKLTGSFQAIAIFSLAQLGFRNITGTITDAIEFTKELDKSMTNIRIVTGATTAELKQFANEYNQMGKELGRTTAEVADAFGTFYRQGLEGAQAADMVKATIVGATVAGESLVEVADKLTSVINGFQLASTEAMSVMDKFATLDAAMATSFKEMSYAMTKIASAAHNANMSLDETLALVATISEVTREAPENIGTALKTMVARMRGITDEGFVTDETIQDMNKVDKALRTIGISQKDARGEMRNTYEVLDELGRKWNTLSSSEQSYVATAVAGSRQTTRFYAMIENWDKVMDAHNLSLNSSGKAMDQFGEAQNSIEYQMKQTRAAMEGLYRVMMDSSSIIGVNKAWQSFIGVMTNALKVVNPMTIGILALNRGMAGLVKNRISNLTNFKDLLTPLTRGRDTTGFNRTQQDIIRSQREITPGNDAEVLRLKAQQAQLNAIRLNQKELNLLTQEQRDRYDAIVATVQRLQLETREAARIQQQLTAVDLSGGDFEVNARQRLLDLANDLNITEDLTLRTNQEIRDIIDARAAGIRANNDEALRLQQTENENFVRQMETSAAIKNTLAEVITLGATLIGIWANYDNAINSSTNRFELATARAQKNIQVRMATTQFTTQTLSSASNVLTGEIARRASTQSTLGANLTAQSITARAAGNTAQADIFAAEAREANRAATSLGKYAAGVTLATTALNAGLQIYNAISSKNEQERINKEQRAYEKLNKALEDHVNELDTIKELQKELLSMGAVFDNLSKGVNEFGKNLSLTSEEFAQYNEYVNRLTELMPEIIKGYDAQGRAILDNTLGLDYYIEKLKEKEAEEKKGLKDIMPDYISEKAKDITYEGYMSSTAMYARGKEYKTGLFKNAEGAGSAALQASPAAIGAGAATFSAMGGLAALGASTSATGVGAIIGIPLLVAAGVLSIAAISGSVGESAEEIKDITEEEQQKMDRQLAKVKERMKQMAKETLQQTAEISKATSDSYQALDDRMQKIVDLSLQRVDFSTLYADRLEEAEKQHQAELDKIKDPEEKQKRWEEIQQEILDGIDQLQEQSIDIFSDPKNAISLDIAFKEEAELTRKLDQGKISMQQYVQEYNLIKQSILDILTAAGIQLEPDEIDAMLEGMGFSSFGEEILRIKKRLESLNIEFDKLGPLSIDAARGIETLITSYAILNNTLSKTELEEWRKDLNEAIKASPQLATQLGKITKATKDQDWRVVEEEIRKYNETINKLGLDTKFLIDELNNMHLQVDIDPGRAKQLYASAVNELRGVANAVTDVTDIFSKVDEAGRISMDNLLEIAGKREEIWNYVSKDAEGLLVLDASSIKNLMVDAYEQSTAAIRQMRQQLAAETESTEGISILGNISIQLMKDKNLVFNEVDDFFKVLNNLTTSEQQKYAGLMGITTEQLQQMIANKGAFTEALRPIVTEDNIKDAIGALRITTDEASESMKALNAELKMLENVDISVKITEQLVTLRDDLDDATWSLQENKWALEDARYELAELPNVLAKAERAWEKAQKAWERAPRTLEKAIKTYNKTMKKLIEDEAVLELEFKYDMSNFNITPVTNQIDLLKTSIELLGDTDPSQSMQYYSEILSATVNKSALLNDEMERLMNTQAASGAEAKVLANEIDNISKALMDNYKQGIEARNKINEMAKKQQEEASKNRQTIFENEKHNMDLLTKSIDESISKLQKGSWGRGLGGQLLIRSVFERPDKTEKDPVKVKQIQDELMIEEHQKYLERINELNKQAAKENYETTKADFEDSRIDAEWALHDAYEANKDALIAYNDAFKTYEKAQRDYARSQERIPHQIAQLEKEGLKLETKITNLQNQITGLEDALTEIEIRQSENLAEYLKSLEYSGVELEKVLDYWTQEAEKSAAVKENMALIASMTAEELDAFLKSGEMQSIASAFFESIIQLNEEDLDAQAQTTIREINDSMLQAFKEGDYEAFTTKINAVLNTETLTPDLEKMYSDVSTKSDVFMNERKKKQEQLLDELVDYTGITREAAEEALSNIKATLYDPTKEWTDTMKEVGKTIQKIFDEEPIVIPLDFKLLDALDNLYTGTDKLQQYYSGTNKLQQYSSGIQQGTPNDDYAMTGELGREIAVFKDGSMKVLGKNGPEMSYLPKGTVIYNHNDTEKIFNYIKNPEQNKVQNYFNPNNTKNNKNNKLQAYKDGTTSNFGPVLNSYTKNWNNFNEKRTNKKGAVYYHQGNDLAAPTGTPIYAPEAGTIIYPFGTGRGLNPSAGYNVKLKFSNGYSIVAMHMNKPGVYESGTQVPKGTIIGYVGNTGDSSGSHLHLEVRSPNGTALNPSNYFPSYSGTATNIPTISQSATSQLNKHLGGVFSGRGKDFENAAKKAGIDPYLLAAIAMHETGNGTSSAVRNKNNPGGFMDPKTNWSTVKHFNSLVEGLNATANNLYTGYISKGLTTIAQIQTKYAPIGAKNDPTGLNKYWTPRVTEFYEKLTGQSYSGGIGVSESNFDNLKYTLFDSVMSILGGDSKGSPLGDAATAAIRDRFNSLKIELSNIFGQKVSDKNIASETTAKPDQAFISSDASKLYKKNKDGGNTLLASWDNAWKFTTDEKEIYGSTSKIGAYADGTTGTPRTEPAVVGEKGFEIAILPNGQIKVLGKKGAELVKLPKGTVIYDHDTSKMIKNYVPGVESQPMKTYASGTEQKISTYANGTKKLSEMTANEYSKEIDRVIKKLEDFGIATDGTAKLMNELKNIMEKATKLRTQWNEEEKKYFELRRTTYARSEGAEFELGIILTKTVHETINSIIDQLIQPDVPTDASSEEISELFEQERAKYIKMFKDDFETFNRLVEGINESTSQELTVWNEINKKYIKQYGQSLLDISAEAIVQAEKTKLKIEKIHSDLYTITKSTVLTDIQKSYNAFSKNITSFYDALKTPNKKDILTGTTTKEVWNKNIEGLDNLSKLIKGLGSQADDFLKIIIANKKIVKASELAYNKGQTFWGSSGFPTTMTDEQVQNIKDYAKYNNDKYIEAFGKLGYSSEQAMKMGASINDGILDLFEKLGGTTGEALEDMIALANSLDLQKAGASTQQINDAMKGASDHAKKYIEILTGAGTESEKQAKLQKQMIDDLYNHSIKTQMALYEFNITSSEAEIKREQERQKNYEIEARSIYKIYEATGTLSEAESERLSNLIGWIEESENKVISLDNIIQQAMSAKFAIAYEQAFKRFNERLEKMNKEYERTVKLNESLRKGNNVLFSLKESKDSLSYVTNKLEIIKEYIEGQKRAQLELANLNEEAYKQIQQNIEAAQEEEFNLILQQNELFFEMMEKSWGAVEKVLDRIKKRMDNMKFELGVKDTIADLEMALMEVDALRGIVDMSALSLTPDLDAAANYYKEAINSSYDLLEINRKMLEDREKFNNIQIDGFKDIEGGKTAIEQQKEAQQALNEEIQSTAVYYQKMAEKALEATVQMKEQLNILKKQQAASKIAYDTLIKQKEDELAALEEAKSADKARNDILEAKLDMIKALDDVTRAYVTGAGIEIMRPDIEKVTETKAKVEELEREQVLQDLMDALKEEIQALKDESDEKNKFYSAQIEALSAMITAQEELANRFQEEAETYRSEWLDMVTGVRDETIAKLEKTLTEQMGLIGNFKDGLDRWFAGDLTNKILIPITADLDKASKAFDTGIKTGEEIVKEFKGIIKDDLSSAIKIFNNTVEDWGKILGDIFGDNGSFHKNLSDWLTEYQRGIDSTKYASDYPGNVATGGTSAASTIVQEMRQNSELWKKTTDTNERKILAERNEELADKLEKIIEQIVIKDESSGIWYLDKVGGEQLYTKKYASGGLADFTGPAWLDGTKEDPELVLNQQDTKNFITLVDLLRHLELEQAQFDMEVKLDPDGILRSALQDILNIMEHQDRTNKIYIDNINLPNVQTPLDFINEIGQFVNMGRNQIL